MPGVTVTEGMDGEQPIWLLVILPANPVSR
jgi:hypothetical protein